MKSFYKNKTLLIILLILVVAAFFRLYNINFGLPYNYYADEPEISELAIKYTYEFKDVIANKNYYKLIPINFVYGTFPVYVFTVALMAYSKTNNIIGNEIIRENIIVFLRIINSVASLAIIPLGSLIYYKLFKDKKGALITASLITLNWKLIVHAHYLNQDIILTLLLTGSFFTFYNYFKRESDTKYTVLTGILFGVAVGTKITALISLPAFLYIYFRKKDVVGFAGFILTTLLAFIASNPFSLLLSGKFFYRIYEMLTIEGGMVFDSINSNPLKYAGALLYIATPLVGLIAFHGIYVALKKKSDFTIFLLLNIVIYLAFFSMQSRLVERWLLPILPVFLVFAGLGITDLLARTTKNLIFSGLLAGIIIYSVMNFPISLLFQFQRYTPKGEAYLWLKENKTPTDFTYVVTEEGLDPLNGLKNTQVLQLPVYASGNAQYTYPPEPSLYNYIILSSRPMTNFKRKEVVEAYPLYVECWTNFENEVVNSGKFELVKEFKRQKPNLIPLSDVSVYKKL